MQLFSFGHPCEHQLRRACIGGSSCPLHGYPDLWCCSYIKGKINFKRDKPCEGAKCRWGFTHPSSSDLEDVTKVLNEARVIASKIDEADDDDLLSFQIDSPYIADTVQCSIYMIRHSPSTCGRRLGQLLAYAAVKAGDPKMFMQLLKTMKKPVDSYILGGYMFLTRGNPPQPNTIAPTGKGSKKNPPPSAVKREDIVEELRNDTVDLMNAALSQGGQLVDRDDQHVLQATFIQALRQYKKSNKKRQAMLEAALSKFGNRVVAKEEEAAAESRERETRPENGVDDAVKVADAPASEANAVDPTGPALRAASSTATHKDASVSRNIPGRSAPPTPAEAPIAAAATTAGAAAAAAAGNAGPPHTWDRSRVGGPQPTSQLKAEVGCAYVRTGISKIAALAVPRSPRYDPVAFNAPIRPSPLLFGGLFSLNGEVAAPLGAASVRSMRREAITPWGTGLVAHHTGGLAAADNGWGFQGSFENVSPAALSNDEGMK